MDNADTSTQIQHIKKRFDDIRGERRGTWEHHWQELAEYVQPRKVDFVGMRTDGEKRMQRVYDSTALHANQLLAAALHGLATNPAARWFSLRMTDDAFNENDAVKSYLSDVERVMWAKLYAPGTNFATSLHETYLDLCTFGTAVMFVGECRNGEILTESRPLSECFISENEEGVIDTVFRRTCYTARQLLVLHTLRGWKLSERTADLLEAKKFEEKCWIIHAVTPRTERDPSAKNPLQMPFASVYFEEEGLHKLQESGFPEFSYMVPRWSVYAGEVYGRSPAMEALPDIKMLNSMMLVLIKALQKAADPPMWLPDDGTVGPVRTIPGGVNYYRGDRMPQLHPTSLSGIQVVTEAMENLRDRIRQAFYVDVVQTYQHAREQTAFEVEQRQQERMRLMGPLVGRLESELLGRLVERVYGMLDRKQDIFPEPPEEIMDQRFTVEYVSPLANVQKQSALRGIEATLGLFANMDEPGLAVINRNADLDAIFRNMWVKTWNNDPDELRPDEEIEAARQQMAQASQMQAMQPGVEMAATGAGAMRDLAQAGQAMADPAVQGQIGAVGEQLGVNSGQIQQMLNGGGIDGAQAS